MPVYFYISIGLQKKNGFYVCPQPYIISWIAFIVSDKAYSKFQVSVYFFSDAFYFVTFVFLHSRFTTFLCPSVISLLQFYSPRIVPRKFPWFVFYGYQLNQIKELNKNKNWIKLKKKQIIYFKLIKSNTEQEKPSSIIYLDKNFM